MNMKTWDSVKVIGGVAVATLLMGAQAQATLALNYPSALYGNQNTGSGDRAEGFVFTVGSRPISVDALGTFDNPGSSGTLSGTFNNDISVAIYKVTLGSGGAISSGTRVVSPVDFNTASPGTLLAGTDTRQKPITAVTLTANSTYMIVANHYGNTSTLTSPGTTEINWTRTGTTESAIATYSSGQGITFNGNDYFAGNVNSWDPTFTAGEWSALTGTGNPRWTGGNFDFTPVPEVGHFAMAGVGLLGLVYIGRYVRVRRNVQVA
jgi:hypothetical protein